jgi:hypothetical protein
MNSRFPRGSVGWLQDRGIASAINIRKTRHALRSSAMLTPLKTALIAGMIGLTSLAAVPAKADSLYLGFGDRDDDARFGVYLGDNSRREYRRDRYEERREWRRSMRRGCSTERALDKASEMGLRRVRVVDVSNRTITVSGRQYGDRVRVTFARERGCPVIGY